LLLLLMMLNKLLSTLYWSKLGSTTEKKTKTNIEVFLFFCVTFVS